MMVVRVLGHLVRFISSTISHRSVSLTTCHNHCIIFTKTFSSTMRSASNIPRALRKDQPRPIRILIPIYHDFNTFDVNGPIEILSQANRLSKTQHFKITIAAAEELTTSVELVRIARNISLADAIKGADDWDVLLLPGGTEPIIMSMIQSWHEDRNSKANELMRFVDEYVAPDSSRFTFTVCTGSLFLGALGKLNGRTATTHWGAIPTLKKIVAGLPSGTIVALLNEK